MDAQELQERIDVLRPWHYQFELNGATTPIYTANSVNRHEQRRHIGFDPLVQLAGGSLKGKRVLDLACNSGYWSLAALEAGAEFVLGIDARQLHLDQAQLVFETKGVDPSRYAFELGDIFEYDYTQQFDVVLCLGLMYHIAKPLELFEVFSRVGASLILIDTIVNLIPVSAFRLKREDLDSPRNAVKYETTLIPNRQAVLDLARQFGYDAVPLAQPITDYEGMKDFKSKSRAFFICSKDVPLDSLDRERTDRLTLGVALLRKAVRRNRKRVFGR